MACKEISYCDDWCLNRKCEHNYEHIKDLMYNGQFSPSKLILFYINPPKDCKEIILRGEIKNEAV